MATWKNPKGTSKLAIEKVHSFDNTCSATQGVWPNVPENKELANALAEEKAELFRRAYSWPMKKELHKVE